MDIQSTLFDISVLMPVFMREPAYGALRQLERAVASVTDQKFPARMELLIIDDGSPVRIEDALKNSGIGLPASCRIVASSRNNGLVYALNRGLLAAKYNLIARLDADDIWLPGKIERQIERFKNDPDLSIVATGMTTQVEDGAQVQNHIRPDGWPSILRFCVDVGCPFPHGSILARKDIYLLLGGYPHSTDVAHCEDFALWSVWLRFFKPAMIEEIFYKYTVSSTSVSGTNWEQQQGASASIRSHLKHLDVSDRTSEAINELASALNISVLQAGVLCYRLWRFRPCAVLPSAVIHPIKTVLADRDVVRGQLSTRSKPIELASLLNGFGTDLVVTKSEGSEVVTVN